MGRFINKVGGEDEVYAASNLQAREQDGKVFVPVLSRDEVYRQVYAKHRPTLEKQLADLDSQHTDLTNKYAALPTSNKRQGDKLIRQAAEIEKQMDSVEAELENLNVRTDEVVRELETRQSIIKKARQSVESEQGYRRRAELIGQVIDRIVCHFIPCEGKGMQARSLLLAVEVFPKAGAPLKYYPKGNQPERD